MKNIKLNKTENLFKLNDEKSDLIFEVRYVLRFDKFKRNKQKLSNLLYPEQLMKYSNHNNNAFEVQVVYKIKDVEDFTYRNRRTYSSLDCILELVFDKFDIYTYEHIVNNTCHYSADAQNENATNKEKIVKLIEKLNSLYTSDITKEVQTNLIQFLLDCDADISVKMFFAKKKIRDSFNDDFYPDKINSVNKLFVLENAIEYSSFDEVFNVSEKLKDVRELMTSIRVISAEVDISQKCIVNFEVDRDADDESVAKDLVLDRFSNQLSSEKVLTEENLKVVSMKVIDSEKESA